MEGKPFNHSELEASGIVVRPIEKDFGWGTIEGYHLLSPAIAREPERQGDGWFCEELLDGRLFAAVIDISTESFLGITARRPFDIDPRKSITEKRLLLDFEGFLKEHLKLQDLTRLKAIDILRNIIMPFDKDYLKEWQDLLWGFSVAIGLFDPKNNMVDLANLGTNIVAQEESQGQFQAVLSPKSRFYAPRSPRKQRYGGRISPQTRTFLPFQRKILFATDGIITDRPLLGLLGPLEVILEEDPSSLLVPFDPVAAQKAEGLYIVIQRKVT